MTQLTVFSAETKVSGVHKLNQMENKSSSKRLIPPS
jgi:hypothetical protein